MKMLITKAYEEKINGTINCYDRVNIKCTAGTFGYADGMGIFFNTINRRCFEFHKVFEGVTKAIIENTEKIAAENNMEIEYIRNVKAFRKDDKIADILEERGEHEGTCKNIFTT